MEMNKKIVALAIIVCVAIATAVVYVAKSRQPSQSAQGGSEFNSVNDQLNDLGNFLNFENQTFDFNLGDISGGWG
jgi:ABC-type oligopeptide transport system substrate-binding subunit